LAAPGSFLNDTSTPATGHLIGYARTSRRNQNLDRQINALTEAGCQRIYRDQLSGKDAARSGLTKALEHLLEGDTLVVTELSRLGRSLQDLITIVADLRRHNVGFRSPHEQLDTTTPGGRLVFHVFAALAVISSSPDDQDPDLGCNVPDGVFDLAA
jgi:DNA invertase Pin-like site-specific DNA recombinase